MVNARAAWQTDARLARAQTQAQRGEVLQAEMTYRALLADHPSCAPAAHAIALFAMQRDDLGVAHTHLRMAVAASPTDGDAQFDLAQVQWALSDDQAALATLKTLLQQQPSHHLAWLVLADVHTAQGNPRAALQAQWQGISRAQAAGQWTSEATTDPQVVQHVVNHIERMRVARREHFFAAIEGARQHHGSAALSRVEKALTGYLGEWDAIPTDPRQRPKFLYFPDLPAGPYHDPYAHPWAAGLQSAWREIRQEAQDLLADDRDFVSFLDLKPGQSKAGYIGGDNPDAAWDAFFFYRHGQRFDANHARCPVTSAALAQVDLCHVNHQAPEVCFSVIRPRSTIEAHHGVTNTRMVMHLPLIVPPDCALNIVDGGEHAWREGELMMFDDTYQHEAWNKSDQPRLILLMDCWNPHLTPPERTAVKALIDTIDAFENATDPWG